MFDIIERAARALHNLLAEHRDEFDERMKKHIETVTTNEKDAAALRCGVDDAVAEHLRRHRADMH